jgi:hypothetical protein
MLKTVTAVVALLSGPIGPAAMAQQLLIDGTLTTPVPGANAQANTWDVSDNGQPIGNFTAPYYQHFQIPLNLDPTQPHTLTVTTGGWILIARCPGQPTAGSQENIYAAGGSFPGDVIPPDSNRGTPGLASGCVATGWVDHDQATIQPYTNWVFTHRQDTAHGAFGFSWSYWWRPNTNTPNLPVIDPRNEVNFATIPAPPGPPNTKRLSPDTKNAFKQASAWTAATAGAAGTASGFVVNPTVSNVLKAIGGMLGLFSFALNDVANDPIDPNYTDIAQAIPYSPLPVLPANTPKCAQNIITHLAAAWGTANAAHTSYNRVLGAIQAGNTRGTNRQTNAMLHFGNQLQNIVETLQANPQHVFGCLPTIHTSINSAGALAAETALATSAPTGLQDFGLDDQGIQHLNGLLYVQDPALVAAAFNAMFADSSQRAFSWQQLANGLPPNGGYTIQLPQ